MRVGIDASNLRGGGGITHLAELLRVAQPGRHGFEEVVVWSNSRTLGRLDDRSWLRKVHCPLLDRSIPFRVYWQGFLLDKLVRSAGCSVLFIPGGSYLGTFRPFVAMSQNLLPFQWSEASRFGFSWMLLRFFFLRRTQIRTLSAAAGTIFLTEYARSVVMCNVKELSGLATVIPHGINSRFYDPPSKQREIGSYSLSNPFRILYVSIVNVYKHQWHVAEGVALLRKRGLPIRLDFVGPAYPPALKRLEVTLKRLDPNGEFISYRGAIAHVELHNQYRYADAFVFASTCETFGQIVLEAMASGLPIASADTGTMRELLGESAFYFDPEQPETIADAVEKMITEPSKRYQMAWNAYDRAKQYSWENCADNTFAFIAQAAGYLET